MFYFENIGNKKILKSDLLPQLNHFFTTRQTVIKSKEPEMLSLAAENRKIICEYLGVKDLIHPKQIHSANIDYAKEGVYEYPETDALILANKSQAIFLNFADCTPVIFYDKKQKIGAISHAGWRGTAQKIAPKTVEKMNANPEDIIAVIGPAISICCYDVGQEVFDKLKPTVENFEGLYEIRGEKTFIDLKGINARQLEEFGVKQIDICPYCTSCNNDLFFSYRKENATTNRHSAVIKL